KYDIPAVAIGEVIEEETLRIVEQGQVVADVPVQALAEDVPENNMPSRVADYYKAFQSSDDLVPQVREHADKLRMLLQQPTIASKRWAYDQFNSRSEEHTSELQSRFDLVCRLL